MFISNVSLAEKAGQLLEGHEEPIFLAYRVHFAQFLMAGLMAAAVLLQPGYCLAFTPVPVEQAKHNAVYSALEENLDNLQSNDLEASDQVAIEKKQLPPGVYLYDYAVNHKNVDRAGGLILGDDAAVLIPSESNSQPGIQIFTMQAKTEKPCAPPNELQSGHEQPVEACPKEAPAKDTTP